VLNKIQCARSGRSVCIAAGVMFVVAAIFLLPGCPGEQVVIGKQACLECHSGGFATPVELEGGPHETNECEGCHGSGLRHVSASGLGGVGIDALDALTAEDAQETCGVCHESTIATFADSPHVTEAQLTCASCHDVHQGEVKLEVCGDCHAGTTVGEGLAGHAAQFDCSKCHNVHGGATPGPTQCAQCHSGQTTDFDQTPHVISLSFSCANCHDVHEDDPIDQNQCTQCHNFDPAETLHGAHGAVQNCTACHDVHQPVLPDEDSLCATCHAATVTSLASSSHSWADCSQCHSDFTAPAAALDRSLCARCHETQGAEDSEHGAGPGVECTICHNPHTVGKTLALGR
jgi:hypothetical protein